MAQQMQATEGYSALDAPLTGRAEGGSREPFPLGTYYFSFQNLIRGIPSNPQFDTDGSKERCKFVFRCEEAIRTRKWAPSTDFPNPRSGKDFEGEEFHHYCNFYAEPTPRMEIHRVISAIIGHPYEAGEQFVPRSYVGQWVEVTVGLSETNKPKLLDIQPYVEEGDEDEPEPEPVAPTRGRRSAQRNESDPF